MRMPDGRRVFVETLIPEAEFTALVNHMQVETIDRERVFLMMHPPASMPDTQGNFQSFYHAAKSQHPGALAYVGYTMFETDRIPPTWPQACNIMDEIWVPSEFNRQTFSGAGVAASKIHVVPLGLEADTYRIATSQVDKRSDSTFRFLSVFEWNKRKGYDLLLRAYAETFSARDDVALVLRTYRYPVHDTEQLSPEELVQRSSADPDHPPKVVVMSDGIPADLMPALYASCDAFVLPSRGEGWGIPYMEAMASGLPTIGTRWSGNMEFMTDENAYLIDVERLIEVAAGDPAYPAIYWGHQLAEPSFEHLKLLMRCVYEKRDDARERGLQAQSDISNKWSRANALTVVSERLRAIQVRTGTSAPAAGKLSPSLRPRD